METPPDLNEPDGDEQRHVPDAFTIGRTEVRPVPEELRVALAPSHWYIHEWTEFQLSFANASHLRIGTRIVTPGFRSADGLAHFRLRFENELGLATIQPLHEGRPSGDPLHLEVIAKKFPTVHHSLAFMNGLLTDLFARGAALPFDVVRRTQRTIRDERRAPNDLFAFHFFRHHHESLIRASQAILGHPHRVLSDRVEHVRIHEVKRIERDSLIHMLQTATGRGRADRTASPLHRLGPERVLQRIPEETFDTPENRFVLSVSRRMLTTMQRIRRARWFPSLQESGIVTDIALTFDRLDGYLRQLVTDPRFVALDEPVVVPAQSRVLQHKDGYRELTQLWDAFHRYQDPVYEQMRRAIDLRDVPTLYEYWLLFELIEGIQQYTGTSPVMGDFSALDQKRWDFRARFPGHGQLIYQASYGPADIYSGIQARPDFVWEREDGRRVVMDAKFALSSRELTEGAEGDIGLHKSYAMTSNIGVMHGYRDAIRNVSAAIVLFPGNEGKFRSPEGDRITVSSLADLLPRIVDADLSGVGSIPMSPFQALSNGGTLLHD